MNLRLKNMYKENFEFKAYNGRIMENELLGKIKSSNENGSGDYIKYRDAMERVKRPGVQPFEDPSDPCEVRFASDLHATLADKIGLEDYNDLRFYTAVGSQLDFKHGVDAFFEVDMNGKTFVITLDVSMNERKKDESDIKADVLISMPGDGLDPKLKEDKEEYHKKLEEVSNEIIDAIEEKYDYNFKIAA
jgi:hypothetical protein